MAGEWSNFTLGDLCSLITDGKHGDCEDQANSGFYFLSVKDVVGNRLVYENARQITERDFSETHRRTNLEPGDVLFTNTGTIGRMAIAQDGPRTYCTTFQKSVAILKPKRDLIDPNFLYYLLHFDNAKLSDFAAGTTQKNLLLKDLRSFTVQVPPLPEQRAIAHILGTLDGKIELNRRINETLESIARAIFQSWFVDFDPVRAKAEGRDPGLPEPIADLFPDSFEDSELREIPAGWRMGMIGEVAENSRRGVQPNEIKPTTPYIGLEHMPRHCIALSEWDHAENLESNKFEFKLGEILFGKLRPYFHKVGVAPVDGICSTAILVIRPKGPAWFGFILGHVSSVEFIDYTDATSTGTKMPRTSWQDMARYEIALPPTPVAAAFTERIRPLTERIMANIHESCTLAALRDELLPKLISGEIRVEEAMKSTEEDT